MSGLIKAVSADWFIGPHAMFLESTLLELEANPELVVVASKQMVLVAAVLSDDEQSNPLAIQMTTLEALKVIYRRQEFISDAELEVAVAAAFDRLTSMESED